MRELEQPRPVTTVATIVERNGAFLVVEEETRAGVRINQPAGHLEAGESLVAAAVDSHDSQRALDEGILRAFWLSYDDLTASRDRHRSPLVLRCVEDFRAGLKRPLDFVTEL